MTSRNELQSLKTIAKRIARARRIPLHTALDQIAARLDQPHWNALTAAWASGWSPTPEPLSAIKRDIDTDVMAIPVLGIGQGVEERGSIDGHAYSLEIDFAVMMAEIG